MQANGMTDRELLVKLYERVENISSDLNDHIADSKNTQTDIALLRQRVDVLEAGKKSLQKALWTVASGVTVALLLYAVQHLDKVLG